MASHSKADDLEVVEEKIVKRYKPVSTKSIRIPIKIPKSLSAEFQRKAGGVNGGAAIDMLSSSLSSEDFEKIKSLAGLGGKVPRITNCSLHLSGSRRSPSLGPPETVDLTADNNLTDVEANNRPDTCSSSSSSRISVIDRVNNSKSATKQKNLLRSKEPPIKNTGLTAAAAGQQEPPVRTPQTDPVQNTNGETSSIIIPTTITANVTKKSMKNKKKKKKKADKGEVKKANNNVDAAEEVKELEMVPLYDDFDPMPLIVRTASQIHPSSDQQGQPKIPPAMKQRASTPHQPKKDLETSTNVTKDSSPKSTECHVQASADMPTSSTPVESRREKAEKSMKRLHDVSAVGVRKTSKTPDNEAKRVLATSKCGTDGSNISSMECQFEDTDTADISTTCTPLTSSTEQNGLVQNERMRRGVADTSATCVTKLPKRKTDKANDTESTDNAGGVLAASIEGIKESSLNHMECQVVDTEREDILVSSTQVTPKEKINLAQSGRMSGLTDSSSASNRKLPQRKKDEGNTESTGKSKSSVHGTKEIIVNIEECRIGDTSAEDIQVFRTPLTSSKKKVGVAPNGMINGSTGPPANGIRKNLRRRSNEANSRTLDPPKETPATSQCVTRGRHPKECQSEDTTINNISITNTPVASSKEKAGQAKKSGMNESTEVIEETTKSTNSALVASSSKKTELAPVAGARKLSRRKTDEVKCETPGQSEEHLQSTTRRGTKRRSLNSMECQMEDTTSDLSNATSTPVASPRKKVESAQRRTTRGSVTAEASLRNHLKRKTEDLISEPSPVKKVLVKESPDIPNQPCEVKKATKADNGVKFRATKVKKATLTKGRTTRQSARMSFGNDVSPQQLQQAQTLARKKLVAECEAVGQPVPKVLIVTEEERMRMDPADVIDIEDIDIAMLPFPEFPEVVRPMPLTKKLPQLMVSKTVFLSQQMGMKVGGVTAEKGPAPTMLYVPLAVFSELLTGMKYDLEELMTHMLFYDERNKLTKSVHHNINNHFLYENWRVSHVSVIAARELCALFNNQAREGAAAGRVIPKFVTKGLRDLTKPWKAKIELGPRVTLDQLDVEHVQVIGQQDRQVLTAAGSSVAVATAGRCSRRVKHATARLAGCDGDFKNMMASFDSNSSDDSFLTFGNDYASAGAGKSVSELVAEKDAQFQKVTAGRGFSGRLKPCYRHFRWQAWPNYRLPSTVQPPATPPSKRKKSSKVDKTSTSHCDSPVQQTDCFKKPQSPLKKGVEEKEVGEEEGVRKVIRPVRKFASNDVLARYVEEYGKPQQEEVEPPPPAKKVRANNPVDLPMFCLSGLVESRPVEAEGWFVNKISQLKRVVAEATAAYKATTGADDVAKQSSKRGRPSTGSSKAKKSTAVAKKAAQKVSVAYSDGLEPIVDLEEFNRALHMQIVTLESFASPQPPPAEAVDENRPPAEPLNVKEVLFVAKRVEKVSVSGINRPKAAFTDTALLSAGWIKFTDLQGRVSYQSPDGLWWPTLTLALNYLEASKEFPALQRRRGRK